MRLHDVNEVRSHVGDLDGPCPGRLLAKATGSWSPPAGDPFGAGPGRQLATRTERVLVPCWRPRQPVSWSPVGDPNDMSRGCLPETLMDRVVVAS